jgi:hypothetical protein
MPDELSCMYCGKTSSLKQWFVTTAFVLAINVDLIPELPIMLYFCPNCGLPNSQRKENSIEKQPKETPEELSPEITKSNTDESGEDKSNTAEEAANNSLNKTPN